MHSNHLRGFLAILLTFLLLVPPVQAKNKGDKEFKQGQKAEEKQQWDEALEYYERALAISPSDPQYLIASRKARFQAGSMHVIQGQKLRNEGNLEGAITEFQRAILKDPSSAIALQEWRRTSEMLEVEKKKGVALTGPDRGLTPAERVEKEDDQRLDSMLPAPELRPITPVISTLRMNNQPPKVLFDTVGKLAGINVVFDPQYQSQGKNYNIDLSNTSLEQALDYLAVLTKTFWKPISSNTIFVAEDNVTKRRDYEDNVVKVFYVKNATSVQEFQEIATAVRSVIEIRRVFTYNAQRAIVMRGTTDQIALAEKLIRDLDKPKGEVVVEVIVMEANRSRTRDLALALQSNGAAGLSIPVQFTPRNPVLYGSNNNNNNNNSNNNGNNNNNNNNNNSSNNNTNNNFNNPAYNPYNPYGGGLGGLGGLYGAGTGTGTQNSAISLAQLGRISTNDFSTTLPGALLNLVVSDQSTKVYQHPQVRASDGQKVTLRIGDKIPYATGSFGLGLGGVGGAGTGGFGYPGVQTQFQFADVGVNLDVTPQVHGTNEVTLKLAVEISQVRSSVNIGGLSQPIIGQRKSETELRLRDGEVNILGGLSQDQDSKSKSGIPGVVDMPVLGGLLGSEHVQRDKGELLIAIIPHIVRTPDYTEENLRGVLAGTDQSVRVQYAPRTESEAVSPGNDKAAPKPQVPAQAAPPAPPQPEAPKPAAPQGFPRLSFLPPAVTGTVGNPINITLQAENVSDLFSAVPIRLKFDPKVLRLNDVTQGQLLNLDGQQATMAKDVRNDTGEASVTIARPAGAPGVSGTGALVTFSFVAIGKGNGGVMLTEFGLRNNQNQPITIAPAPIQVVVE